MAESDRYRELIDLLRNHRFRFGSELQLQNDVEAILKRFKSGYERERRLPGAGTIDFLVAGGIGIECKIDGGKAAVLEQLARYADRSELSALILLSSRHTHRFNVQEINRKPFAVIWVGKNCL